MGPAFPVLRPLYGTVVVRFFGGTTEVPVFRVLQGPFRVPLWSGSPFSGFCRVPGPGFLVCPLSLASDVEESCYFLNAELKIHYQKNLILLSFIRES